MVSFKPEPKSREVTATGPTACACHKKVKRVKEKTKPFGVNLMRREVS